MKQCINCHQYINDLATICPYCNQAQPPVINNNFNGNYNLYDYETRNNAFDCGPEGKSRGITALLALFLGGLGIQYFYLDKATAGIITILLSLVTCGFWSIIPFIQAIYLFCIDNRTFREKFVTNPATFPIF